MLLVLSMVFWHECTFSFRISDPQNHGAGKNSWGVTGTSYKSADYSLVWHLQVSMVYAKRETASLPSYLGPLKLKPRVQIQGPCEPKTQTPDSLKPLSCLLRSLRLRRNLKLSRQAGVARAALKGRTGVMLRESDMTDYKSLKGLQLATLEQHSPKPPCAGGP